MPQVDVGGITINYDVQGEGEPLLLIPYLSADHACYAFQLPAYTEHFRCIALDLPGTGESDKPPGPYSTELYADQVAAFLGAIGIERAHVAGVSLGAAVGMHLAARHPGRMRSLSLHSGWHVKDAYLNVVVEQWRTLASALPTVADVVLHGIFPWCFTPEMYVDRPDTGYSISLWDSLEEMQSYEQGPLAAVMSELEPYFGGEFATQRCELRRREGFGD